MIEKVTETMKKDVTFLVDVDPEFVSLVKHGANQQPFRVVKSNEKGGEDVGMVVQSILLPKHVTLEALQMKKGLEWLADARTEDIAEFGEYAKVIQMKEDKFDEASLNLVKLDESGAYAMIGSLVDKADKKTALTIGRRETEKVIPIEPSPMDQAIAEEPRPAFVLTFRDMFEKELHSFLDVVRGALSQSNADEKKRKAMVMNALDAFKSFLAIGIDAIGMEAQKIDDMDVDLSIEPEGGSVMFTFKDEQEFTEKVTQIVKSAMEVETPATEEEPTDEVIVEEPAVKTDGEETPAADDSIAELKTLVGDLATKVTALAEKQDELEQQPATESSTETDDEVVTQPTDKTEKSVFAGLLVPENAA